MGPASRRSLLWWDRRLAGRSHGDYVEDFLRHGDGNGRRCMDRFFKPANQLLSFHVLRLRQNAGQRQMEKTASQIDHFLADGETGRFQGNQGMGRQFRMLVEQPAIGVEGVRGHAGHFEQTSHGQQGRSLHGGALTVVQTAITGQRFAPLLRRQIARMHAAAQHFLQLSQRGTGDERDWSGDEDGRLRLQCATPSLQDVADAIGRLGIEVAARNNCWIVRVVTSRSPSS